MPHKNLINFIDRWRPQKIVVVGDFMLDRMIRGNVDRLSPDAPVPVLTVQQQDDTPGGAANVCRDLAALRCQVAAVGVVGDDQPADILIAALNEEGIDTAGLLRDPARPTIVKQNYVGLAQHRHPQKMFRVDIERCIPLSDTLAARLLAQVETLLDGAAILCIEDYNKGLLGEVFCQKLIALGKSKNIPILIDPAAIDDYRKYRGATCLTPNRTEAQRATATAAIRDDAVAMAQFLLDTLSLSAIVLTLDKQGALLLERGGEPVVMPTHARAVYDVTGAGDMILAMLAAAIANGAPWPDAVELANVAAGLEVEKFGVAPIALEEILLTLLARNHQEMGKIRTRDQLLAELSAHRAQGAKIAFTNGCFDILHAGHVAYLRHARRTADLLVVAVNTDASIRRIKGPNRPVNTQADRLMVLSELQSVDYLILFDDDTPRDLIEAVLPAVLVKGADYTREQVVGHDIVEAAGGKVVLVPLVEGRSTTNLIQAIRR